MVLPQAKNIPKNFIRVYAKKGKKPMRKIYSVDMKKKKESRRYPG